jgi:hypothetical protein
MNIRIGNKNKIKNSPIGNKYSSVVQTERGNFASRHPILISFLISIVAGFLLLFSFWKNIVQFIEEIFN